MKIEITDVPEKEDVARLLAGLIEFNSAVVPNDYRELGVFIRQDQVLIAGAYGASSQDWVHIEYLWVDSKHRRASLGRRLLKEVEKECQRRGCIGIHLDTYSFQALPFYEKCGFIVFGSIADHPRGGNRYFLKKEIKTNQTLFDTAEAVTQEG
jgi:GNAT superfamily N-acetyltransferase